MFGKTNSEIIDDRDITYGTLDRRAILDKQKEIELKRTIKGTAEAMIWGKYGIPHTNGISPDLCEKMILDNVTELIMHEPDLTPIAKAHRIAEEVRNILKDTE